MEFNYEQLAQQAKDLYKQGLLWKEIECKIGISGSLLSKIRKMYMPETIRPRCKVWSSKEIDLMMLLHKNKASYYDLYEAIPNHSHEAIRNKAASFNLTFTRKRNVACAPKDIIKGYIDKGYTNKEIADEIDCTERQVYNAIRVYNLNRGKEAILLLRQRHKKKAAAVKPPVKEPIGNPYNLEYFERKERELEALLDVRSPEYESIQSQLRNVRIKIACLKQKYRKDALENDDFIR